MTTGLPVIVVHLAEDRRLKLTACSGESFIPDDPAVHPEIPRILCSGCKMAVQRGTYVL